MHFHLLAWRNAKKKKKRKLIWDKSAWKESYWLQNDFPRSQKANLCGGLFQEEEGEKKFRQVSSHRASLSSSGCQRETLGSERQLQLKLRRPELPRKAGGVFTPDFNSVENYPTERSSGGLARCKTAEGDSPKTQPSPKQPCKKC